MDRDAFPPPSQSGMGILMQDPVHLSLMESLSHQLELEPKRLSEDALETQALAWLELVVAETPYGEAIRKLLAAKQAQVGEFTPALVGIMPPGVDRALVDIKDAGYEAVLTLQQDPAYLLAQLSVVLYAHRAYVRRYGSALEELQLTRSIFTSLTSGISVANATLPGMPLMYVNPAFESMTGYRLEEVQGRNCRFLQGEERDQAAVARIREALQHERELVTVLKNFRKDGTPFWNELSLSPIHNRKGQLTHFVGIQTDVTARVEFEAALLESEKLAAVGRLAASIAHEINNPLAAVTNMLYLAQEAGDLEDVKRYVRDAADELSRASMITAQSLRFYRQSTKAQAADSASMLDTVLDLYQRKLWNAGIRVEIRHRRTQAILCFESEVQQVISNLVRNAIDAMSGGGRLLVRSRNATEWRHGTKGIVITIADTGRGIPAQVIRQIYQAFFTTKPVGGTGLGLWVSSEIVNRHGGRLLVRSSCKAGASWTVFELFLPFVGR